MSDEDGCRGKPTCWRWLGDPSSNGLMRVFADMQESQLQDSSHDAAALSGVDDAQRAPPIGTRHLILDIKGHSDNLSLHVGDHHAKNRAPLPQAVVVVVLCMEIALVLGVGFLLLMSSSVVGTFVRSLLKHGAGLDTSAVDGIIGASLFLWGMLRFASWFFQVDRAVLIRELGFFKLSGSNVKVILAFVAAETVLVSGISWLESSGLVSTHSEPGRQAIFSWENVLVSADAPVSALLDTLILAPLKEELFFRGLVFFVVWNRLQLALVSVTASLVPVSAVTKSALIANVLFAGIHLANLKKLGPEYSLSYITYQVGFAWLVGTFLSLRLAVSQSLLECALLHVVNNVFAMAVSKHFVLDFQESVSLISVLSSVLLYSGGIGHALRQLSRLAPPKQLKTS